MKSLGAAAADVEHAEATCSAFGTSSRLFHPRRLRDAPGALRRRVVPCALHQHMHQVSSNNASRRLRPRRPPLLLVEHGPTVLGGKEEHASRAVRVVVEPWRPRREGGGGVARVMAEAAP